MKVGPEAVISVIKRLKEYRIIAHYSDCCTWRTWKSFWISLKSKCNGIVLKVL